jgi:hypothetical protein
VSRTWEIADILDGVIKHLGGPWPFRANFTFLACELAKSDLTAGIDKVFEAKAPIHWFTLECELTPEASFWQWNPAISKPQKKGNKTETP